jgi:hypothetical protein
VKVKLTSFLFFLASLTAFGQGLTAYVDFRQQFVVFDNGVTTTLEIQPIQKFDIGGKCIPYIDNLGYFKIYFNKKVYDIAYGTNIDFKATDNLVSFYFNDQLWVFENGIKKMLSIWVKDFKTSDYTMAYLDNAKNTFNIYQEGQKQLLEDVQTGVNDFSYRVGENIVAYTLLGEFKIHYLGQIHNISFNNIPTNFEAGRNIVVYNSPREQSFNAFYKGKITKLEDFQPNWYKVGDNMVLYKDQLGNLKIFYEGEVKTLSNYEVSQIDLIDNICSFVEQGQFKIFYKGELKTLEYVPPTSRILDQNSVLYIDQTNSLKYFDGENSQLVTSERVSKFDLNINTISYQNSSGINRVFFKGELY